MKIVDTRRMYHGRPPLLRRLASGDRSQRRRESGNRHTDLCNDYTAKLLPYVSQAVRYDRYCRNGTGELWGIYKLDVVVIPTNRPIARNDMNDRVYKTKREKYKAVIEEIEKMVAAGRPVLVGTTSVEISEMLSKMLTMRHIEHSVLNAKLHQKEADIVAKAGLSCAVTIATNMAGCGTDIKLSPEVKAAGGLAIIGTERHESRRVDRQLRGRAGRQGDPGSSVFFVSLEDDLMRLFFRPYCRRYGQARFQGRRND